MRADSEILADLVKAQPGTSRDGAHSAGFFGAVLLLPVSAQNAQIWAASVLTGTEPASVQNGGSGASACCRYGHGA